MGHSARATVRPAQARPGLHPESLPPPLSLCLSAAPARLSGQKSRPQPCCRAPTSGWQDWFESTAQRPRLHRAFFFSDASFSYFLGYAQRVFCVCFLFTASLCYRCSLACTPRLAQPPADAPFSHTTTTTTTTFSPLLAAKQIVDGIIGDSAAANGLD
ncbi:hypothetical protein PWT90_06201 [Aphanocladium album]|nr:hypothetical protein PWT90_06201 [Aphanocladium album]